MYKRWYVTYVVRSPTLPIELKVGRTTVYEAMMMTTSLFLQDIYLVAEVDDGGEGGEGECRRGRTYVVGIVVDVDIVLDVVVVVDIVVVDIVVVVVDGVVIVVDIVISIVDRVIIGAPTNFFQDAILFVYEDRVSVAQSPTLVWRLTTTFVVVVSAWPFAAVHCCFVMSVEAIVMSWHQ